ncbi:MAG: TM2 domain-containing protein [Clostridia bacterium]|nr:TM2 domain-containing protein [Clostridia bacterium]
MEEKANLTESSEENLSDLGSEERFLKSHMLCGKNYSEDKIQAVKAAKLKSVTLAMVLSAFLGLFGAGSFYLGYWKRGFCKIVFNVLVPLALGLVFLFWLAPMYNTYHLQADDTISNVAYSMISEYGKGYSESYNAVKKQFDAIDAQNGVLKTTYGYLTRENDEEKKVVGFDNEFNSMIADFNGLFTDGFIQNVNALSAFGELISEDGYKELETELSKASVNYSAVKTKLEAVLNSKEISALIETAEKLPTDLTAADLGETVAEIKELNEKLDALTSLRDTDDLFAVIDTFEESPLTDKLLADLKDSDKAELIKNMANLRELFNAIINDLKAKYLALTGESYVLAADREESTEQKKEETLSSEIASLVKALTDGGKTELADKLNDLKDKIDALNINSTEDVIEPLTQFINDAKQKDDKAEKWINGTEENKDSGQIKIRSAFTIVSELNANLNSAANALKTLSVNELNDNGEIIVASLYENFRNSQKLVYSMIQQAPLYVEYLSAFRDCTVARGADKQLNYTEVSSKYVDELNAIDELTEIYYKIYDAEDGEIFYDSRILDIEKVMEHIDGANTIASDYTLKADGLSNEWEVDGKIVNMLFIIVLAILGAIIVAYWIGEVFKDRAKCLKDNYDKIKNILQ